MFTSPFTELTDRDEIARIVREAGVAHIVTTDESGHLDSTLLPIQWSQHRLVAHAATNNPQFHGWSGTRTAMAIVTGAHGYVSPRWFPRSRRHGHGVPTWNYELVHFHGRINLHHETDRLREEVERLSHLHERDYPDPWEMKHAPAKYIEGMLQGIVGIEMKIERVEAKAKLSQNRTLEDREALISHLMEDPYPGSRHLAQAQIRSEERRTEERGQPR